MQKQESKKQTNTVIKWILATVILVTLIIGGAFISGTFYPNVWTVKKIEAEVHKKELSQVQLLGLKEPEFEYSDKATFLTATGKCVEYLNYTTDRLSRVPTSIIAPIHIISAISMRLGNPSVKGFGGTSITFPCFFSTPRATAGGPSIKILMTKI